MHTPESKPTQAFHSEEGIESDEDGELDVLPVESELGPLGDRLSAGTEGDGVVKESGKFGEGVIETIGLSVVVVAVSLLGDGVDF